MTRSDATGTRSDPPVPFDRNHIGEGQFDRGGRGSVSTKM